VHLVEDYSFALPVTQAELSDALGITTVHVNRVLQELRGENLISLRGGALKVLDWAGLKSTGEFDAAYLHLVNRKAL
jgi:CRP-like cAMP-binding protein